MSQTAPTPMVAQTSQCEDRLACESSRNWRYAITTATMSTIVTTTASGALVMISPYPPRKRASAWGTRVTTNAIWSSYDGGDAASTRRGALGSTAGLATSANLASRVARVGSVG